VRSCDPQGQRHFSFYRSSVAVARGHQALSLYRVYTISVGFCALASISHDHSPGNEQALAAGVMMRDIPKLPATYELYTHRCIHTAPAPLLIGLQPLSSRALSAVLIAMMRQKHVAVLGFLGKLELSAGPQVLIHIQGKPGRLGSTRGYAS
jgi:hypothetical protein